jgi:hypothetical protein
MEAAAVGCWERWGTVPAQLERKQGLAEVVGGEERVVVDVGDQEGGKENDEG